MVANGECNAFAHSLHGFVVCAKKLNLLTLVKIFSFPHFLIYMM